MSAHRFFVLERPGERAVIEGSHARQIASVLRLGPGETVVLVHDGEEATLRIDEASPARVAGTVVGRAPARGEPRVRLTLALPLLRGDRGEEVVEAVTQLGVSRIVPFTSERSVVTALSTAKRERWQRIARESAETARRGRVPAIEAPRAWAELFDALEPPVIVAWEEERSRSLREAAAGATALSLVIGPEGGLSPEEVELARRHSAATVSLGRRNLRSETAAIAAVSLVIDVLE